MALRIPLHFDDTDPIPREFGSTDELSLGKYTALGVGGVALDAGNQSIVNVATPVNDTDAVTKAYADSLVNGLDWKASCRVATTANVVALTGGAPDTVDGVALSLGDRVLVKDQGTASENGIYEVQAVGTGVDGTWVRASDADADAEVTANLAVFVAEGAVNADTGWTLVSNDPLTVGVSALSFTQFTGLAQITAGAGLSKAGSTLSLVLDTDADPASAGDGGGSSGLEFDVAGDGGQLRAKVDPAGGVVRNANGLGIKTDETVDTLDVDAAGLRVTGVPALFKINNLATGASVTSANLNTLTNGSNADALHAHSGQPAVRTENSYNVTEAVAAGDPLYFDATANQVSRANADGTLARATPMGVARTAQGVVGQPVPLVSHGPCPGVLAGATPGAPYYLAVGGGLSASAPVAGNNNYVIQVGIAINATDLFVAIERIARRR